MTTASTGSLGFDALLATLVLSRISMVVPVGSSAARAFQKRQARRKMNFMARAVLTLILSPFQGVYCQWLELLESGCLRPHAPCWPRPRPDRLSRKSP